jgi:hypothetical protein
MTDNPTKELLEIAGSVANFVGSVALTRFRISQRICDNGFISFH